MKRSVRHIALTLFSLLLFGIASTAQVRRRSPRTATSQQASDWTFPRKGMNASRVAGRLVYDLGHGFFGTLPRRSAKGGQYALILIAEEAVDTFVTSAERNGDPPDEFLAYGVFGKVFNPPTATSYLGPREVEVEMSQGTTRTEYFFTTSNGATARIYIAQGRSSALVVLDPPDVEYVDEALPAEQRPHRSSGEGGRNQRYTFEELRASYLGNHRTDILKVFGTPSDTYDVGERVAWTYRNLAYDPVLGRYKNVKIWFDKHGYVDRITE